MTKIRIILDRRNLAKRNPIARKLGTQRFLSKQIDGKRQTIRGNKYPPADRQ